MLSLGWVENIVGNGENAGYLAHSLIHHFKTIPNKFKEEAADNN